MKNEIKKNEIKKTGPASPALKNDIMNVLELIQKFGSLLEKETTALRKADFKAVDAFQEEKKQMAKSYQTHVAGLCDKKADILNIEMTLREKLVKARIHFSAILNDNLRALDAAKDSSKRLVDRILEAAREASMEDKTNAYTARGRMNTQSKSPLSISMNQQL